FFSSRRRHTRFSRDWSSDVCSSDLASRFGAALLEGLFPLAKQVFGGITGFLDTATEKVKPFAEQFSTWIVTSMVPAAESLLGKEIGRASGRESGYSCGAAGDIKKKG